MSALTVAVVAQIASSCLTASSLSARANLVERVAATAQAESGLLATALRDNTTDQSFYPGNDVEAAVLATALRAQGHSVDAGIMQINDSNWRRLGLTAETVFDPRQNICAGMQVIAEAYALERRVSCRYNTGRADCTNGYPEHIEAARQHVRTDLAISPARVSSNEGRVAAGPTPIHDPYIAHAAVREIVVTATILPTVPSSKADEMSRSDQRK